MKDLDDVKICVPLKNVPFTVMRSFIRMAKNAGADMIEIWADGLTNAQGLCLKHQIARCDLPVMGVSKLENEEELLKGMKFLIDAGVQYIDVDCRVSEDAKSKVKSLLSADQKLVISYHNYSSTPDLKALQQVVDEAIKSGANFVKIATTVCTENDERTLFSLITENPDKSLIVVPMGFNVRKARLECVKRGGKWTYGALHENLRSHDGQPLISELK